MHFWIDKRSQGCGFRPQFLSVYGRNQRYIGGFHPKPMVTPIRRFQSLPSSNLNNVRNNPRVNITFNHGEISAQNSDASRRIDMITYGQSNTPTPQRGDKPVSSNNIYCFVCFMCVGLVIVLPCAKYYFRFTYGVEGFVFSIFIFVTLLLAGLLYNYRYLEHNEEIDNSPAVQENNHDFEEPRLSVTPENLSEMPPPPYHIAIMLPDQDNLNSIRSVRDSPPPSYQKAIM